jgi:hypothetical protein
LKNGDKAYENDVIQITYLSAGNEYGFIFSFDGNGNITRHFPEDSWQAQKLSTVKQEVPLDFSYKLDDAPDYECFVFVSSKEKFELNNLEDINKNKLTINYIKKGSFLPKNCEESLFILNK